MFSRAQVRTQLAATVICARDRSVLAPGGLAVSAPNPPACVVRCSYHHACDSDHYASQDSDSRYGDASWRRNDGQAKRVQIPDRRDYRFGAPCRGAWG